MLFIACTIESGKGLLILGRASGREVKWAWGDGVLARSAADGERHFGDCIEGLSIEQEGRLFRIGLRLGRARREAHSKRSALVSTAVLARTLELMGVGAPERM